MIVRTRGGSDMAVRGFMNPSSSNPPARSAGLTGGVPVTSDTVGGVPAFTRAVRILSEAVASLRMRVWTGEDTDRRRVDGCWQAKLLRGKVSLAQTRFAFWETVQESLSKRGNAFIWMNTDQDTGRVLELIALHPDQILPQITSSGIEYHVVVTYGFVDPTGKGFGFYRVGPEKILHIRGHGDGGQVMAPSPIQVYRESLSSSVGRLRHESQMYARGAALRLAVELPETLSLPQADKWRKMWNESYGGVDGMSTGVIGGGGKIKPISMSMVDAEFLNSQNFGVAECARMIGIPASLLDIGTARGTSTPLTPEHERTRLQSYALNPSCERIESAFAAEPALMFDEPVLAPGFDTQGFIRGDLQTEDMIAHQQVQDGRLLVDEWRATRGLDPLPGTVKLQDGTVVPTGMAPQITPTGAAPNPEPSFPAPPAPPVDDDEED